jgi:D-aminoacyl-tRNA deacylase
MKSALNKLKELNDIDFEISMEATHHGPYLEKPTMFIEIGSTVNEWKNEEAGRIVARVIMSTIEDGWEHDSVAIIGGTHYNHEANKLMFDTEYAPAHICPKHLLGHLNDQLINQMLEKSNTDLIVLDWKGLGQFKDKIAQLCKEIKTKKSKELLTTHQE